MNTPDLRGIIFDMNGVLIDDFDLQLEGWNYLSQKIRGTSVSREDMIRKIRGVRSVDIVSWLADGALTHAECETLAHEKDDRFHTLFQTSPRVHLMKGLEVFLDQLVTRQIPRTIATSSNAENHGAIFNRFHLSRWFDRHQVIFNDGTYPGKPAPDAYLLAAATLQLEPKHCLVFEDAQKGIESAYRAGIGEIIAVNSPDRLSQLLTLPGVTRGIHDFTEISVGALFPH